MHGSAVRSSMASQASFQQRNSIPARATNENKTPTKAEKQQLLNEITEQINKKDFQEKLKKLFTNTDITQAQLMEYLTNQNSEFDEEIFRDHLILKNILKNILKCNLNILDQHRISSWFSTHTESYKIACSAIRMVLYNCFPKEKINDEKKPEFEKLLSKILESDSINLSVKDYSKKQDHFIVEHFKRIPNGPSDKKNLQKTSFELQSGGIRNKNYTITVDFHNISVSHKTNRLLEIAQHPEKITDQVKQEEIMPFVTSAIDASESIYYLNQRNEWINSIEKFRNFDEFKNCLTKKQDAEGFDDSPENQEKIAYYILSRNRHLHLVRSSRTNSIKSVLKTLDDAKKGKPSPEIMETLQEIKSFHTANTSIFDPCAPLIRRASGSVYPFNRIDSDKYVIFTDKKILLGRGGSKEVTVGLMVTIDEQDQQLSMQRIAITKQNEEAAANSRAIPVIKQILDVQNRDDNKFEHLHLGYYKLGDVRYSVKTSQSSSSSIISEYSYQRIFDGGTLAEYPIQDQNDLIDRLIQITKGLIEATQCDVVVRDLKPENVFVETDDGKKKYYLADMDDWRLKEDPEIVQLNKSVEELNFKTFKTILRQLLSDSPDTVNDFLIQQQSSELTNLTEALLWLQGPQNS